MREPNRDATAGRDYLAFDIEIERVVPQNADDLKSYRPLGISCAATLDSQGGLILWHGRTPEGGIADRLSREEAAQLVGYLERQVDAGKTILTWNGVGFDFDILAEESGQWENCRALALDHVDMMFHVFCLKGYALGLDKAARGMGLPGKTAGMNGALAPTYWAQGRRDEVLAYLEQDVRTTLHLAQEIERRRRLQWSSNRGLPQTLDLPGGLLAAREALQLPTPDTSWMSRPWKRSKFTAWLQG